MAKWQKRFLSRGITAAAGCPASKDPLLLAGMRPGIPVKS